MGGPTLNCEEGGVVQLSGGGGQRKILLPRKKRRKIGELSDRPGERNRFYLSEKREPRVAPEGEKSPSLAGEEKEGRGKKGKSFAPGREGLLSGGERIEDPSYAPLKRGNRLGLSPRRQEGKNKVEKPLFYNFERHLRKRSLSPGRKKRGEAVGRKERLVVRRKAPATGEEGARRHHRPALTGRRKGHRQVEGEREKA